MMKVGLSNLRDKLKGMYVGCACECIVCIANMGGACHTHEHIFKRITFSVGKLRLS
jgi:hypothetical protein